MPLSGGGLLTDQVAFERMPDPLCAVAAHAYKAHAAAGQPLDRRNADLILEAPGDDLALVQVDIDSAAHDLAFRFAAASASRALE